MEKRKKDFESTERRKEKKERKKEIRHKTVK